MIDAHQRCPNCESYDTEVVNTEFYTAEVERVRICNDCPTQWVVNYAKPEVIDVEEFK